MVKKRFDPFFSGRLSDYVTAIAWSGNGQTLAATSGAGEVMLWRDLSSQGKVPSPLIPLQLDQGQSVDCVSFSTDGQFLAAGGQDGRVMIWRLHPDIELLHILENAPAWVDHLAWSPIRNQLAFSIGRYVQIWDGDHGEVVATLNFEVSSVLGLSWCPHGQYLAIAGNQGAKIWEARDWDDDPYVVDMPAASIAIAWSADGKYFASGNLDFTITVLEWENLHLPWVMRGFPGKIRNLAWSEKITPLGVPLLAASSVEGIVVWEKHRDESVGWESRLLNLHHGVVQALAFQPGSFLLASAGDDGQIGLWQNAKEIGQVLVGVQDGFSCLAWHPRGDQLAAGGQNGQVLVWSRSTRGKGFG